MDFTISETISDELPLIVKMNQEALPAVSSVNMNDMNHFLSIVDYFHSLKIMIHLYLVVSQVYHKMPLSMS